MKWLNWVMLLWIVSYGLFFSYMINTYNNEVVDDVITVNDRYSSGELYIPEE